MNADLAQALRMGMRRLASGVSILAVNDQQVGRLAMTASSVTSVSDDPPSLLVCVNTANAMASSMQRSNCFSVNVLAADQDKLSTLCAGGAQGEERFVAGDWRMDDATNLPFLNDAEAVFICEKANTLRHGTHDIFIGNVVRVLVSSGPVNPLIYVNGGYHRL